MNPRDDIGHSETSTEVNIKPRDDVALSKSFSASEILLDLPLNWARRANTQVLRLINNQTQNLWGWV